jgi:hypothetical protein
MIWIMNKAEILMFYEMFDDDDISTERLLAMVADAAGCDIDDVVSALADEHAPDDVKKSIVGKPHKGKRKSKRNRRRKHDS